MERSGHERSGAVAGNQVESEATPRHLKGGLELLPTTMAVMEEQLPLYSV